jgi:hypothetical protein
MRKLVLQGRCSNGMYSLLLAAWSWQSPNKVVLATIKPNLVRWHHQLEHAFSPIVQCVVIHNNILSGEFRWVNVWCFSKGMSHQLPFRKSLSVSQAPLELAFSNVWGVAPSSVGRFKYYVSFIDDYSKFTWLYLLKNRYDVFQKFDDFQQLLEQLSNKKILAIQTDWGWRVSKALTFLLTCRRLPSYLLSTFTPTNWLC